MRPTNPRQAEEASLGASDQRTLYLVNTFILDTSRFLNRFALLCERKLSEVHRKILELDASLTLVESQLRTINDVAQQPQVHADTSLVAGPSNCSANHTTAS